MLKTWKKIVVTDFVLFIVFFTILFPVATRTVNFLFLDSMNQRVEDVARNLQTATNEKELKETLNQMTLRLFVRVTLFSLDGTPLFDSKVLDDEKDSVKKIMQVLDQGYAKWKAWAPIFREEFGYAAQRLIVGGVPYVLRAGYPAAPVDQFSHLLTFGFLGLSCLFLLLFVFLTALIVRRISRPIDEIIDAIAPFQEGKTSFLPRINPLQAIQNKEFSKLALTLNALSEQVEKQMDHLRRQKKESEGILDSLGEGIIAFNASGDITFKNRVAEHMLLIDIDLIQKGRDLILQVLQTRESAMQTWTRGSSIYLELTGTPMPEQNGAILVLQDKTSDYKIVEMGKDFVANASHELRTPITIIRGFAEALHDMKQIDEQTLKQITERILRTSFRLEKLVKSLLTLADIEQLSKEKFSSIDLALMCESAVQSAKLAHPNVPIDFEILVQKAIVLGDADLLEMALTNLIENGIKYSSAPAKIRVQLSLDRNEFTVKVIDCGIGIPELDLPHIFDRFYTVDKARSRKSGGAGLGLSIFKTIIEKHGGKFHVESEVGKGSAFSFSVGRAPDRDLSFSCCHHA